jgi:hypothetical protein
MPIERYANNATTTLSGDITSGAIVLTVASSGTDPWFFPDQPQFRIRIDDELLLVTGVSGFTWAVTRGVESTYASGHVSGSIVRQILTRDGLRRVGTVIHEADSYANLSSAGLAGRTLWPTNGFTIERDDGAERKPWGPVFPMVPPDNDDFSWFNQGGASVDLTKGGIYLLAPAQASGEQWRIREIATPAPPFTVAMYMIPHGFPANFWSAGLIMRDSVGGNLVSMTVGFSTTLHVGLNNYNSGFTFNFNHAAIEADDLPWPVRWMAVTDDNTNRIWRMSGDGQHWQKLLTVSRTNFITPNRVGFMANSVNGSHDTGVQVLSWSVLPFAL